MWENGRFPSNIHATINIMRRSVQEIVITAVSPKTQPTCDVAERGKYFQPELDKKNIGANSVIFFLKSYFITLPKQLEQQCACQLFQAYLPTHQL